MSAGRGIAELLNGLDPDGAAGLLDRCCGSKRWVEAMVAARPFADDAILHGAADTHWFALEPADWKEAFARHPRIGDRRLSRSEAPTRTWSEKEQAGMDEASEELRLALEDGNLEYEKRFGYVFLICATGLSAHAMLDALRERMLNDPEEEIRVAAAEQARITRIRLEKLVTP